MSISLKDILQKLAVLNEVLKGRDQLLKEETDLEADNIIFL